MENPSTSQPQAKRGAADSGKFFKYFSEFVGFTDDDARVIRGTKPIIEKHLPEIVARFYAHLLRYPPTRRLFLKHDGSLDKFYVEMRMRHLTNFWLRTADAVYDEDYARYVDYVGRAHTSHGADPHIYIAERYVIGQVGFMQHAISDAMVKELRHVDEDQEVRAVEAWDKLMMVILEMLARAYENERETETFDALVPVDEKMVARLAEEAFEHEHSDHAAVRYKKVRVAGENDIAEGERKIVQVDALSIAVFRREGKWHAIRNQCLHRGGPVGTGKLEDCVLTCPWHGFQYDVTDGHLLIDPKARLDTYSVIIEDAGLHLFVPDVELVESDAPAPAEAAPPAPARADAPAEAARLKANEFMLVDLPVGKSRLVEVEGARVAVFNVAGALHATQEACTHMGGPLSEGGLDGSAVTCPWHGSCFDVTTGKVLRGPAGVALRQYHVTVDGDKARVE